jgi:cadmium resistance protein CadD (predicted permease)
MANLFAYVIGAALVGILHMSAPDHWLTLCVLARNKKWAPKKLFGISFVTAIGHVALSVAMGLIVVVVGLVFSHLISYYLDTGIGLVMVGAGLVIGIIPLVRKSAPHNHDHEHEHNEEKKFGKLTSKVGYFAILGAALSPDPSIIPIYLSAISAGFYFALELSVVFAVASITTLLLLVQLGTVGLAKTLAKIPEKYNDSMVGFVIMAIGIYVLVVW